MMKEDKFMNNLKKNINNIYFQMKNNGIIFYNKFKIIYYKIKKYHQTMIKINK